MSVSADPDIPHCMQGDNIQSNSQDDQRNYGSRIYRQSHGPANLPQRQSQVFQKNHASTSANSLLSSPSATTLPSKRWICRSAWAANRGSCVTMQIVAPS